MTWICNAYIIVKLRRFKHAILFGMSFDFNNVPKMYSKPRQKIRERGRWFWCATVQTYIVCGKF